MSKDSELHHLYWSWSISGYGRPRFDFHLSEIAKVYGFPHGHAVSEYVRDKFGLASVSEAKCMKCGAGLACANRDQWVRGLLVCPSCTRGHRGFWREGRLCDVELWNHVRLPIAEKSEDDSVLPAAVLDLPHDIQEIVKRTVALYPVPWTEDDYALALATAARLARR